MGSDVVVRIFSKHPMPGVGRWWRRGNNPYPSDNAKCIKIVIPSDLPLPEYLEIADLHFDDGSIVCFPSRFTRGNWIGETFRSLYTRIDFFVPKEITHESQGS